jgi:hypothetical protein
MFDDASHRHRLSSTEIFGWDLRGGPPARAVPTATEQCCGPDEDATPDTH